LLRKPQRAVFGKLKSASGRKPFEFIGTQTFFSFCGQGERDRLIWCVLVENNELLETAAFCENDFEIPDKRRKMNGDTPTGAPAP